MYIKEFSIKRYYFIFSKIYCQYTLKIDIYLRSCIQYVMLRRTTVVEKTAIILRVPINYYKLNENFGDCNGILYPCRQNNKRQAY